MTTRIYEKYICSEKTTNTTMSRLTYFNNKTLYGPTLLGTIDAAENLYAKNLQSTGKWQGELIIDNKTTTVMPFTGIYLDGETYSLPTNYVVDDHSVRIGNRMFLTDMTLDEFYAGTEAWMADGGLSTEYQQYLAVLDQMRNDPAIVWRLDWTLVSTTP